MELWKGGVKKRHLAQELGQSLFLAASAASIVELIRGRVHSLSKSEGTKERPENALLVLDGPTLVEFLDIYWKNFSGIAKVGYVYFVISEKTYPPSNVDNNSYQHMVLSCVRSHHNVKLPQMFYGCAAPSSCLPSVADFSFRNLR